MSVWELPGTSAETRRRLTGSLDLAVNLSRLWGCPGVASPPPQPSKSIPSRPWKKEKQKAMYDVTWPKSTRLPWLKNCSEAPYTSCRGRTYTYVVSNEKCQLAHWCCYCISPPQGKMKNIPCRSHYNRWCLMLCNVVIKSWRELVTIRAVLLNIWWCADVI